MAIIDLKCFLPYPCEARGLELAWHMLEKAVLHRHVLTVWSLFCPFLFQSVFSTVIHGILQYKYDVCYLLHYLGGFFTAGSPTLVECFNNLMIMLSLCEHINAPIKPSKIEGPSICLSFLGIVIDITNMQASISEEHK